MNAKYSQLIFYLQKADTVLLFHHTNPDFDTYSSVFAFYHWIKHNFKSIKVSICLDKEHLKSKYFQNYIKSHQVQHNSNLNHSKNILGIVFDVCQYNRIYNVNYLMKVNTKIVFDHHCVEGDQFDLKIIKSTAVSTTQMLTDFFCDLENHYEFSEQVAHFLFYGLVTDTGRFLFLNNEPSALTTGAKLISLGALSTDVYKDLYTSKLTHKRFMGYILSNFLIVEKLAYIVISNKTMLKYHVTRNEASGFVNLLSQIENVEIHGLITENIHEKCWSVSLRSKSIPVNEFAAKYKGGGHKLAAGLKLEDYEEVKSMLNKLQIYSLTNDK